MPEPITISIGIIAALSATTGVFQTIKKMFVTRLAERDLVLSLKNDPGALREAKEQARRLAERSVLESGEVYAQEIELLASKLASEIESIEALSRSEKAALLEGLRQSSPAGKLAYATKLLSFLDNPREVTASV